MKLYLVDKQNDYGGNMLDEIFESVIDARKYIIGKYYSNNEYKNKTEFELQNLADKHIEIKETIKTDNYNWSDKTVIDFVNFYIKLHKLSFRYELENMEILDSFKKGDKPEIWHKTKHEMLQTNLNKKDVPCLHCGCQIKEIYNDEMSNEEQGMYQNGCVDTICVNYASDYDGSVLLIGLCDDCIKQKLEENKIKEKGEWLSELGTKMNYYKRSKVKSKIINIIKHDVLLKCLINEENKIFESRTFSIDIFTNMNIKINDYIDITTTSGNGSNNTDLKINKQGYDTLFIK